MSTQKRYPRLSLAAFLTAAVCSVLGFVQADGFFVLSAFLILVGFIFRRGISTASSAVNERAIYGSFSNRSIARFGPPRRN